MFHGYTFFVICPACINKVFDPLLDYPWCLAIGDVDVNLDIISTNAFVLTDATATKILRLLHIGFCRDVLKDGIALIREIPWSTFAVEQAHGSRCGTPLSSSI